MRFDALWHSCLQLPRYLLKRVDDALMPLRCVFCGTRTRPDERFVCAGCRVDLPWLDNARSPAPTPLTAMVAPLAYEFPIDAALKALKYKRRLYYAPAFGEILSDAMTLLPGDIDALLPVPLHWRRKAFRGFNQALEISKEIRRHRNLPLVTGVTRRRATCSQAGLSAAERQRNVRHAFAVRRRLSFRHVLIIDDVVTTGATARQIGRSLLKSGVKKVSVLAVAKANQAGNTGLKM